MQCVSGAILKSSSPVVGERDERAVRIASELVANGREDSFLIVDLSIVRKQLTRWQKDLPRVKPFYAIKCHPDEELTKILYSGGSGFDAASPAEIDLALRSGASPAEIIYANPCKQPSHIRYAESRGVNLMTFDNMNELRKIKANHSNAKVVVRILADDSSSICKFNLKFGVAVQDIHALIMEARVLNLDIVGVSFHVGSGCRSADAFANAVERARAAFDELERFGFTPYLLDLGGGFPGSLSGQEEPGEITFEEIASALRPALDRLFPIESGVSIIAEPGRYFANASGTAVVNVSSKRVDVDAITLETQSYSSGDESTDEMSVTSILAVSHTIRYYVNDGVYATFNNVLCDHRENLRPAFVLSGIDGSIVAFPTNAEMISSTIFGNTCDGIDVISCVSIPECEVNDWFVFSDMGAYTSAASSKFNGFNPAEKIYIR